MSALSHKRKMLPSATLWKRADIARLSSLRHRTKPTNSPRAASKNAPKNDLSVRSYHYYYHNQAHISPRARGEDKPRHKNIRRQNAVGIFCRCVAIISATITSQKKAQGRGARMRPKNPAAFAAGLFRMRSSFERGILRADESRPRRSIPSAVLARGKTKYARKRSAQNRILTRRPWATTQSLGQGLHR